MSWLTYHRQSEMYASQAATASREQALPLYRLAAESEWQALQALAPSKLRTLGITAVSTVALWYKAGEWQRAQQVAYQCLANSDLPEFAAGQLRELLQAMQSQGQRSPKP